MRSNVAAVGLALLAVPAVAATSITAIVDDPARFAGREVTVGGTVTEQSIGYGGESVYTIQDGDRRITVFSRSAPPSRGERLDVSGTVGLRPPDEEFTFPPIILERERRAAQ